MRTTARLALLGLIVLLGGPAYGLNLQADITAPPSGVIVAPTVQIRGTAHNADAEGVFVDGGLQAFYYDWASFNYFGTSYPLPDAPQAGEWNGRNSEFAANPWSSSNWWLVDNQAFRTANSIPGSPSNNNHAPYIFNRCIGQLADPNDDDFNHESMFGIRMEGKIVVPADTVYQFNGDGDDLVTLYVDGRKVHSEATPEWYGPTTLSAGEHGFVAEFVEHGGGQNYWFSMPAGATLKANPQDEHTYAGYTVELGRTFAERRPGMLTMQMQQGQDGGPQIGGLSYFKGRSSGEYHDDAGPAPTGNSYRMVMAGYWNVPADGLYDFRGWSDDRHALAVSDDPNADPWTLPLLIDDVGASDWVTVDDIALTAGWRPFRIEFGEGGGGANWGLQWQLDSNGWDYFHPDALMSTDDAIYDWELLASSGVEMSVEDLLFAWDVPEDLIGQTVDIRLRAYATDHTYAEDMITLQLAVPEPASLVLLGGGLAALAARRRKR